MTNFNWQLVAVFAVGCTFIAGFTVGRERSIPAARNFTVSEPQPSEGLKKWAGAGRLIEFNQYGTDKWIAHTFMLARPCTPNATLTAVVKPGPSGDPGTDAIGLHFIGPDGQRIPGKQDWCAFLGSGQAPTAPALRDKEWKQANFPDFVTFELKLSDLPTATEAPVGDLIPTMNELKFFDVVIQDDSIVKSLTLTGCE